MKLSDNSIDRLRSSVNRIVEKSKKLEKENHRLAKISAEQSQKIEAMTEQLAQTTAKLNAITLGSSLIEVSGGPKIARQRINNLLRDIDRCISLVNK